MTEIESECSSCGGTGLYRGLMEQATKGLAVICISCDGSGRKIISYKPFTGRKKRTDITTVRVSSGRFIFDAGKKVGPEMSYDEWWDQMLWWNQMLIDNLGKPGVDERTDSRAKHSTRGII